MLSNCKLKLASIAIVMLANLGTSLCFAQANDQKALERAQAMLRQLNSEKTAAEQKLTALQQEYENYKKDTEKKLEKITSQKDKASSSLENWQTGYNELKEKYQELQFELIKEKQWASDLHSTLKIQNSNFDLCKTNNQELADISSKLIDLFEGKGFVDLVREREIFTGIKRVELENFVQDTRYQVIDRDLKKSAFMIQPANMPVKEDLPKKSMDTVSAIK